MYFGGETFGGVHGCGGDAWVVDASVGSLVEEFNVDLLGRFRSSSFSCSSTSSLRSSVLAFPWIVFFVVVALVVVVVVVVKKGVGVIGILFVVWSEHCYRV